VKTIGLLGGMSWQSTELYYRLINEGIKQRLGRLHPARIAMVSVDFQPIEEMQHRGDWEATAGVLSEAAQNTRISHCSIPPPSTRRRRLLRR
jgi:aspartate racemase